MVLLWWCKQNRGTNADVMHNYLISWLMYNCSAMCLGLIQHYSWVDVRWNILTRTTSILEVYRCDNVDDNDNMFKVLPLLWFHLLLGLFEKCGSQPKREEPKDPTKRDIPGTGMYGNAMLLTGKERFIFCAAASHIHFGFETVSRPPSF